ncbi:hypothetical protein ACKWTF_011240 [Chironomus riparius]
MISIGTINYPQDEIEYFNKEMKLRINTGEFERGELIITKTELAWKKDNADSQGFSIPWDKIVVQAISSENTRSIYFMIDCLWPNSESSEANGAVDNGDHHENEENGENDDDNEEFIDCDEDSPITEFWMLPDNLDDVDNIYYAMTRYPERPEAEESDDENFLDGEDMEQMNINDERFADD